MNGLKIQLKNYKYHSVISLLDGCRVVSQIMYTKKTHKEISNIAYKNLASYYKTYGTKSTIDLYTIYEYEQKCKQYKWVK